MFRLSQKVFEAVRDVSRRSVVNHAMHRGQTRFASLHHTQRQTHTPLGETERIGQVHAGMAVALVSTAALTFGLSADMNTTAYSRAANALPLPAPSGFHPKRRWQLFDQIGSGSFGVVRIGMCEDSGEVAAIKIVEPDQRNYATLEREIAALKLIKALGGHRNIIDLRDVSVEGRKVYLVTELVRGGELFDHIVLNGSFNEDEASRMARDLSEALSFLHSHGLVHKDIKPENILMTSREQKPTPSNASTNIPFVKLADFGSAGPACSNACLNDIGTSAYLPPEFLQSGLCTSACDMWALGCVLYISLCGSHPFDLDGTSTDAEVEHRIKTMPVAFDFEVWTHVSAEAKDLITQLLEKDPEQRMTSDQLLTHPWILAQHHKQSLASMNEVVATLPPTVQTMKANAHA